MNLDCFGIVCKCNSYVNSHILLVCLICEVFQLCQVFPNCFQCLCTYSFYVVLLWENDCVRGQITQTRSIHSTIGQIHKPPITQTIQILGTHHNKRSKFNNDHSLEYSYDLIRKTKSNHKLVCFGHDPLLRKNHNKRNNK